MEDRRLMKLSDKLAALEEQERQQQAPRTAQAVPDPREAERQALEERRDKMNVLYDKATATVRPFQETFFPVDPTEEDLEDAAEAVQLLEELCTRLVTAKTMMTDSAQPSTDTSGTNGTGFMSKPPPGRSDTRVKPPGRSSEDRPDRGKELKPSVATTSSDSSKSRGSFTRSVPYFKWICAGLGALFGFIVASITRDTLHYNGTLGKIVPVLWVLAIIALAALVCYWIGEALNRESDDG